MATPTIGKLSSMYAYAWRSGLKTTYYLRSRPPEGGAAWVLAYAGSCRSRWAGRTCPNRCRWRARPIKSCSGSRCPGCSWSATAAGCCSIPDSTRRSSPTPRCAAGSTVTRSSSRCCPAPASRSTRPWPGPAWTSPDILTVAVSHLHNDHAGGLKHFAGRVPYIKKAELDYGFSSPPGPEDNGIFRVDFDDPQINWRPAEGDAEIAPGGHRGPDGRAHAWPSEFRGQPGRLGRWRSFVFAFDAADLTENIEREVAVGGRIGAGPEVSVEQIRKLKRIAPRRRGRTPPR